ncbi:MAG: hypothetical protein ACFFB5_20480 [Promethearchaeota archaeon]
MQKIDLIIGSYGITVFFCIVFLILVFRYDILLVSGPLSVIPLIFPLNQRKKCS